MNEPRQIPLRLAPVKGESVDGWLHAYTYTADASPLDVVRQAGLQWSRSMLRPSALALGEHAASLDALARAVGLEPGSLDRLVAPFDGYYGHDIGSRVNRFRVFLDAMTWSRFCPRCLEATDGRWQASWRLGWNIACSVHGSLLASTCPECGGRQAQQPLASSVPPLSPTRCALPVPARSGPHATRCGADLTVAMVSRAPAHLRRLTREFVHRFDERRSTAEWEALRADIRDYQVLAGGERRRLGMAGPFNPLEDGDALADVLGSAAAAFLDTKSIEFRVIANAESRRPRDTMTGLHESWYAAGPRLMTAAMETTREVHRPVVRLRWSGVPQARSSQAEIPRINESLASLPTAIWPQWALVLLPPAPLSSHIYFRQVGIIAMLLRGSTLNIRAVCSIASEVEVLPLDFTRCLRDLAATPDGEAAIAGLKSLAMAWHGSEKPINYTRRRSLPLGISVLNGATWHRMCGETGVPPGGRDRLTSAHRWLWEEMTGGSRHQTPESLRRHVRPNSPRDVYTPYAEFLRQLTPALRQQLRAHAAKFLKREGIYDEPLTWEPPMSFDSGMQFPGSEAIAESRETVRELLATDASLHEVATRAGVTLEHVWLLLRYGDLDFGREP